VFCLQGTSASRQRHEALDDEEVEQMAGAWQQEALKEPKVGEAQQEAPKESEAKGA
jgi:hypothetical protein